MKVSQFKQLIKEAVKEALREEMGSLKKGSDSDLKQLKEQFDHIQKNSRNQISELIDNRSPVPLNLESIKNIVDSDNIPKGDLREEPVNLNEIKNLLSK